MTKFYFQNSSLSFIKETIFASNVEAASIVPVTSLSRDLEKKACQETLRKF